MKDAHVIATIYLNFKGGWSSAVLPYVQQEVVKCWPQIVEAEARKEAASSGSSDKVGLPDHSTFFRSFAALPRGGNRIDLTSTYPMADKLVEGADPFPMPWITRARGVGFVPITRPDGTVVFRSAPKSPAQAWVHPGFKTHHFVDSSIKIVMDQVSVWLEEALVKSFASGRVRLK